MLSNNAGTISNSMMISISSSTNNSGTVLTCSAMFNDGSTPATQYRWCGPQPGVDLCQSPNAQLTLGSINVSNIGQYFCTANGSITTSVNITLPSEFPFR